MKEFSETLEGQIEKLKYWLKNKHLDIYKKGWDSYDALPIKKVTIINAIEFLNTLDESYIKSCFVCPCSSGQMHFEMTIKSRLK